jgi:hypothetical protein
MNYIPIDQIDQTINDIQKFSGQEIISEDPMYVKTMLSEAYSWLALSAQLVASTKLYLGIAKKHGFTQEIKTISLIPASTLKQFIESYCYKEVANYEYAERLNACITHKTEGLRSLLSFAKEEMNQIRIGTATK